jgi:IclR family transcriptional regulator, acetate operon repressor
MAEGESAAQPTVRSVERALDLLELLERSPGPLRLVDLSRRSGLHSATVLRILGVLQRRGLVQAEHGEYRMGVAALGMAHTYLRADPLSQRARPHLQELAATTGLTTSLYVRTGDERILAVRVDGRDPLRYQLPLGRRLPLDVGAGRTILAHLPDDERERIVSASGDSTDAVGNVVTVDDLRHVLARVRERGFHISISERDVGVAAVSVPVLDADGDVIAAVSTSGPAELNTEAELESRVPELRRAAHAVGR